MMLDNLIVEKNHKLLDEEIICLSQVLDKLVYECVLCRKNLEHLSKLNLRNLFGIHMTFYYYGEQCLFSSI
jgi:hypothetical protein